MQDVKSKEEIISSETDFHQYLTFFLGEELFGVDISNIREVIKFDNIYRIPLISDLMKGVINLRGMIIPVIDLAYRFYEKKIEIGKQTHIVIFEIEDEIESILVGVIIDEVNAVIDISNDDIEPNPNFGAKIRSTFIDKVAKVNNELVILLNIGNVLNIEELSRLDSDDTELLAMSSSDESRNNEIHFNYDSGDVDEVKADEENFVTFSIGEEFYGIKMDKIREIIEMPEVTHIPNAMPFMKGVIDIRGVIVPLIDMRVKCNMDESKQSKTTSILVVLIKDIIIGLIVESVSDVLSLKISDIQKTPHFSDTLEKDFIYGITKIDEKLYLMIDVDKILTKEELDLFD